MSSGTSSWEVGTVVVERVPYFDVGLDAASIDLDHVLDASGLVEPVPVPYEIARGVTMRPTGAHTVGHCCVDIRSQEERAVMLGHLAISPLHAAVGVSVNHIDPDGAWQALVYELDQAATDGALVAASLWPYPGAARVVATDPYVLEPARTP